MKLIEWVIFGGLALGAHIGLILSIYTPQGGDTGSGGTQGTDSITLTAASAQMTQMIDTWTQPPAITDQIQSTSQNRPTVQPDQMSVSQMTQSTTNDPSVTPAPPMPIETVAVEIAPNAPTAPTSVPVIPPDIAQIATLPNRPMRSSAYTASLRDNQPTQSFDTLPPQPAAQPQHAPQVVTRPKIDTSSAQVAAQPNDIPNTRPKPRPSSVPQIAQSAKGRGTSAVSGTSTKPKSVAPNHSSAKIKSDTATWAGQIRNAIERKKFYPRGTRARGRVVIQVSVAPNGRLLQASVTQSSGYGVLDRAALTAVNRARFSRAPESLQQPHYKFRIPIKLATN